jgi:drug/metabolite transporter (DMT)-like permease
MRYLPIAAFLLLSLLWGSEWMLTASLPAQPHLRGLAIRYGLSAVFLLPWAIRGRLCRTPLRGVANVVIAGIGIMCLPQILISLSKGNVSPAISLVALAIVPVLLAVSGRLSITTAVCGLAGVLFLADRGLGVSVHQLPWLLLPLTAAGVLAWALAGAEKHMRGVPIVNALFCQCATSALLLLIASQLLEHETVAWSSTAAIGFVINAGLTAICGYLLFYWLLAQYGAGRVSMLQWTQTLIATAESTVLMRISPGWSAIAGAILIVLAVIWAFSNREGVGE